MANNRPSAPELPLPWSRHLGRGLIALSAMTIGIYAVPPYAMLDPALSRIPLSAAFTSHMFWLFLHAIPSGIALVVGPFQFMPAIRKRWPRVHRVSGRVYLSCIVLGAATAVPATYMSTAGFSAQVGFSLLVIGWLYSAYHAYRAARARRFADHRVWMIRNYALTFAAVLLRIFLLTGIGVRQIVPSIPFDQIYTSSVWGSILVSSLMVEWFMVTQAKPRWLCKGRS